MPKIVLMIGILVLVFSTSFAAFYVGLEVGNGGFSIAAGMDEGKYLAEFFISPSRVLGIGVGGTYIIQDLYTGKVGNDGKLSVNWGAGGSVYFAYAYGMSM